MEAVLHIFLFIGNLNQILAQDRVGQAILQQYFILLRILSIDLLHLNKSLIFIEEYLVENWESEIIGASVAGLMWLNSIVESYVFIQGCACEA